MSRRPTMSTLRASFAVLLLVVLTLAGCRSRSNEPIQQLPPPDVPAARIVDPAIDAWFRAASHAAEVRFVAGDTLQIDFQGITDYSVIRVIPPDGQVPLVKTPRSAMAIGKTAQELEAEIAAIYEGDLDAYVTVRLAEVAPRVIYVAGAVAAPRQYSLAAGERLNLLQALTLAGGPAATADLANVTITRFHPTAERYESSAPLDYDSILRGEQRDNLAVLPGDTVVVPEGADRVVSVFGHVVRPGSVPWRRGLTLSSAIAAAGGFGEFPVLHEIVVIRGGRDRIEFDFTRYLDGEQPDLELGPGDVIYVNERLI